MSFFLKQWDQWVRGRVFNDEHSLLYSLNWIANKKQKPACDTIDASYEIKLLICQDDFFLTSRTRKKLMSRRLRNVCLSFQRIVVLQLFLSWWARDVVTKVVFPQNPAPVFYTPDPGSSRIFPGSQTWLEKELERKEFLSLFCMFWVEDQERGTGMSSFILSRVFYTGLSTSRVKRSGCEGRCQMIQWPFLVRGPVSLQTTSRGFSHETA